LNTEWPLENSPEKLSLKYLRCHFSGGRGGSSGHPVLFGWVYKCPFLVKKVGHCSSSIEIQFFFFLRLLEYIITKVSCLCMCQFPFLLSVHHLKKTKNWIHDSKKKREETFVKKKKFIQKIFLLSSIVGQKVYVLFDEKKLNIMI